MAKRSQPTSVQSAPVALHGFGRECRLTSPAEFRQVFQKNNRTADRYYSMLYRSNEIGIARLGMAVAKKRVKLAVDRNRLKRLIRESFRQQHALKGVDIVVLPREASATASNADLLNSLEKQWSQIAKKCAKPFA